MRILVTGGAGYVGSMLVQNLLNEGHGVRVVDNLSQGGRALLSFWAHPDFEFLRGDLQDAGVVDAAVSGMDAVVHLAAIVGDPACSREPDLARAVNLDASLALVRAAEAAGVQRFLFASTCSNYGKMEEGSSYVDERSALSPVSLYAECKVAVERALLEEGAGGKMCATCLRFATVFGVSSRMRFDLTVNEFTADMIRKGELLVYGEQFWRPYIHVRDVARAVHAVLEADVSVVGSDVFNVGSTEENYTKKDLVELIQPHTPEARVEYVHKDEDPRDYRVSFEKIEQTLGFTCNHSVPQGIAEVAQLVKDDVITDWDSPAYRN